MDLIHTFNVELVYIRSPFPMGKTGLTLKDGQVIPAGKSSNMISMWGPAVKPGDQARISEILVKNDRIHFEINGGAGQAEKLVPAHSVRRGRRHDSRARATLAPTRRGSYVDLVLNGATCPNWIRNS